MVEQTAVSYSDALRARYDMRKRGNRADIERAWTQAALNGAAFAGKLKPLEHYLPAQDKSRGGVALLGALVAMKKKGVPMQIERIRKAA